MNIWQFITLGFIGSLTIQHIAEMLSVYLAYRITIGKLLILRVLGYNIILMIGLGTILFGFLYVKYNLFDGNILYNTLTALGICILIQSKPIHSLFRLARALKKLDYTTDEEVQQFITENMDI